MSLPRPRKSIGSKPPEAPVGGEQPVAQGGKTRRALRRRSYVLLETVVATGLLAVGLAVLGAQVQDAYRSVRTMDRRIRAIHLAEQQLAELEMGLVELESVDEIEEGDFGPRYPDFGWRLITKETAIENMYLLQLEVLYHHREGEYKEDDFEYDDAETLHTVYAMRAATQPVHLGEDFGLNEEELLDLSEKLAALGIPGLDPEAFDLRLFQDIDFEELVQAAPLILDALGMDLTDLMSMLPPDLLQQIEESGMLDGDEESEPRDDRGPPGSPR